MTPVEKQLRKVLESNAELPFDEACVNIATVALELRDAGKVTSIVVAARGDEDRARCVDVGLPNGDTLEIEIP